MAQKMKCYKCGHEWDTESANPYYVTCPHCYSKISVKKAQVIEESVPLEQRDLRGMARKVK